ncbi:PilZ domain-containing protein [Novosphingobium sp.]|uniref:PilZ domain-containing protein n=1 Tax=Novosphingobium sp. TaxID=1874826 RepID=UPI0035B2D462
MGFHSIPAHRRGNRHFNRLRLGAPASLALTHQQRTCLIDDISRTGARLRVQQPVAERQSAILLFHELQLFSQVVWSRGLECGLHFDQPLDPEDMQGMLWIKENREVYDRICNHAHALDWSEGLGER